jgi:hypothetical protein
MSPRKIPTKLASGQQQELGPRNQGSRAAWPKAGSPSRVRKAARSHSWEGWLQSLGCSALDRVRRCGASSPFLTLPNSTSLNHPREPRFAAPYTTNTLSLTHNSFLYCLLAPTAIHRDHPSPRENSTQPIQTTAAPPHRFATHQTAPPLHAERPR